MTETRAASYVLVAGGPGRYPSPCCCSWQRMRCGLRTIKDDEEHRHRTSASRKLGQTQLSWVGGLTVVVLSCLTTSSHSRITGTPAVLSGNGLQPRGRRQSTRRPTLARAFFQSVGNLPGTFDLQLTVVTEGNGVLSLPDSINSCSGAAARLARPIATSSRRLYRCGDAYATLHGKWMLVSGRQAS